MKILVINSGSSSIKYKLFHLPNRRYVDKGSLEHIGEKGSPIPNHYTGLKLILAKMNHVDAVGHRVVHGGEKFTQPVLINDAVIKQIREFIEIAPLHNPPNLEGILACTKLLAGTRQVAVFDTAFHQTIPEHVYLYGLPFRYYTQYGIRKYGFHGTSHHYVAQEAARILKKPIGRLKIITCHLGNGCSITAVDKGRSVDTSMGFTPLEGLIMGTRCGDIDPALVPYIMHREKLGVQKMETLMNKSSGLLGISGLSNDMRYIAEQAAKGNARCRVAMRMFMYRVKKYIGAYMAVMGGADAVVFTAGIGEHNKAVRDGICKDAFSFMKKKPKILIIPTDEELMIALQTYQVIKRG